MLAQLPCRVVPLSGFMHPVAPCQAKRSCHSSHNLMMCSFGCLGRVIVGNLRVYIFSQSAYITLFQDCNIKVSDCLFLLALRLTYDIY